MADLDHVPLRSLSAAILAGGASSRLGEDKALVRLTPDGPTLLEMTIERVAIVADDVVVVAPSERGYGRFGTESIPDERPNSGVLGGIAAALRHFAGRDVLIVACDHPFLNVQLLRRMASLDGECDVVIPRTIGTSRQGGSHTLQTLHAIYRSTCLVPLLDVLDRGYASARDLFDRVRVRTVDELELRRFDPELESLMSVNTPESLAAARSIAARRSE